MTLTVKQYADALAALPGHYAELALDRVKFAFLDDKILAAHPNHAPIMFWKNEWKPLIMEQNNERPIPTSIKNFSAPTHYGPKINPDAQPIESAARGAPSSRGYPGGRNLYDDESTN